MRTRQLERPAMAIATPRTDSPGTQSDAAPRACPDACPAERRTGVAFGVFVHLGAPVALIAALATVGITPLTVLVAFVAVTAVFAGVILIAEQARPTVVLPRYTVRELVEGVAMIFGKGVGAGGLVVTIGWWLCAAASPYDRLHGDWARILAATFLTDLGYYWAHRRLSHGRSRHAVARYYRRHHAAHHAVTELDFLRGNQSSLPDTAVTQFQPALVLASWLLGMDLGATCAAYALILTLQATDHTSVIYDIGWLRYVFMDNHAHKLHHCGGGTRVNHAAAFSIFDRLWGTYLEDRNLNPSHLHRHRRAIPRRALRSVDDARPMPAAPYGFGPVRSA